MNSKLIFLVTTLLLCVINNTLAQQPVFPKADKSKNIPFGKKQPTPLIQNGQQQKLLKTMYPGAERYKNYDTLIANTKRAAPYFFNNPNSFLMQQLANRDPSITKTNTNTPQGLGSNFHITNDINAFAESDPGNINDHLSSLDWLYPVLNNVAYFEADDGVHGRELMRSNATASGTYLVKDINPGESSTLIRNMVAINGKIFFSASTDGKVYHPWVTDGTESGTQILDGINGGSSYSPQQFIMAGITIYFIADGNNYRTAIWKTDGTPAGTSFIKDLAYNEYAYYITQATSANGLLFFSVYTGSYGWQLWRSDGTDAGTYMVKNVSVWWDYWGPLQLTAYDNKLYFSVDDGTGRKLWISDGTDIGTIPAPGNNDILMQTDYLDNNNSQPFPILNNILFVSGYTYADGNGLYKYDASASNGLVLVKDLTPSSEYAYFVPGESRIVNNTLFLKVISSINGWHDELWSSNGDAANTQLIKSWEGEFGEFMINLKSGYGTLYFFKYDATYGNELWKSDGTTAGTVIVRDINVGPKNSTPWYMTECNGKVIFNLHGEKTGAELWGTNGTVAGTVIVKDINTTATQGSSAAIYYNGAALNDGMVFHAYDRDHGDELFGSNGTAQGTMLLNDINPGENTSYPKNFSSKKGLAYFVAFPTDGQHPTIYQTNGLPNGLKKIFSYYDNYDYEPGYYSVADNGIVFAVVFNWDTYNYELWRSDGTTQGTLLLSSNLYYNHSMVTSGNNAYFVAGDYSNGFELWKSDGTVSGTKIMKDIFPGPYGSYPFSLIAYNGNVYFSVFDDTYYTSLWKSDGTNAGTIKLANIQLPYSNNNDAIKTFACISNNTLFFNAFSNTTYESRLWKTNGTAAGTKQVSTDLYYPQNLTDVNGTLFFTGYDNNGLELYKTGGNAASTKVISGMNGFYSLQYFTSAGGKLFFVANDALWSSDGSGNGTQAVNDPFLSRLNSITNLTVVNNKLFFSAYTYQYGFELFVGNVSSSSLNTQVVSRPIPQVSTAETEQSFKIYPNPARNSITVTFPSGNADNFQLQVLNIAGVSMITKSDFTKTGNNQVQINLSSIPGGTYLLILKNDKSTFQTKIVKQ